MGERGANHTFKLREIPLFQDRPERRELRSTTSDFLRPGTVTSHAQDARSPTVVLRAEAGASGRLPAVPTSVRARCMITWSGFARRVELAVADGDVGDRVGGCAVSRRYRHRQAGSQTPARLYSHPRRVTAAQAHHPATAVGGVSSGDSKLPLAKILTIRSSFPTHLPRRDCHRLRQKMNLGGPNALVRASGRRSPKCGTRAADLAREW